MTTRADRAVVYFGEPIHSGYVRIRRDYLVNVTSLDHECWKRAHPEFCRRMERPAPSRADVQLVHP